MVQYVYNNIARSASEVFPGYRVSFANDTQQQSLASKIIPRLKLINLFDTPEVSLIGKRRSNSKRS